MSSNNHPIVFLPGLLCDSAGWRPVIDHFQSLNTHLPDYPADDNLPAIAKSVLADAPAQFDLAGHSMGGYLALEIMRQAPGRVSRLAMVSTSALADSPEASNGRAALIAKASDGGFNDIAETMARFVIPKTTEEMETRRAAFAYMARRIGAETFIQHTKAIAGRPYLSALLDGIDCPSLAIGAENDRITPIDGIEQLGDLMPNSRTVRFETGGHLVLWTRPGDIADQLAKWRATEI